MRIFRWKAAIPLGLFLTLVGVGWIFFVDTAVERAIEAIGTAIVGAKVELEEVDVQFRNGSVVLRGLQVTDPDAPMTNLVEVAEMVAQVRMLPLLEKKIYIDTVAMRGVKFGTERASSGAIEKPPDPEAGAMRQRIDAWAESVPIPEFNLEGLSGTVDVAAIRPEDLQTPRIAQGIVGAADSARQAWASQLEAINPQPVIDSAQTFVTSLEGASLRSLGLRGVPRAISTLRSTITGVTQTRDALAQLESSVTGGVADLQQRVSSLAAARAADLASARNLLQIPSLSAPDIAPALFGQAALGRVQRLLYWVKMADRYLPPGLDPRRRQGPDRIRLSGTTIEFPGRRSLPGFTIGVAEIDLQLDTTASTGGSYRAEITDLTSSPSVLGRPMRISAARTEASSGPEAIEFAAVLDHVTASVRDSVGLSLTGVALPSITLPGLGVRIDFGRGVNELTFVRTGDSVTGRLLWSSSQVSWDRGSLGGGRVNEIVWRALSSVRSVDVEVRISGSIDGPSIAVRSSVARDISRSLQRELRNEVAAAERRIRAEVERLVEQPIADARAQVSLAETSVQGLIAQHRQRLDDVRAQLETRVGELRRLLPFSYQYQLSTSVVSPSGQPSGNR